MECFTNLKRSLSCCHLAFFLWSVDFFRNSYPPRIAVTRMAWNQKSLIHTRWASRVCRLAKFLSNKKARWPWRMSSEKEPMPIIYSLRFADMAGNPSFFFCLRFYWCSLWLLTTTKTHPRGCRCFRCSEHMPFWSRRVLRQSAMLRPGRHTERDVWGERCKQFKGRTLVA